MNNISIKEDVILPLAIPFNLHNKLEGHVAEYNIFYSDKTSTPDKVINFASDENVYRVNIEFEKDVPVESVKYIREVCDNVYVRLRADQLKCILDLQENEIPYFWDSSALIIGTYSMLDDAINGGVSDVYITDDLVYNLRDVHEYCADRGVQTRLILNHIPATNLNKGKSPKDPIYTPQITPLLLDYFDIIEFDCGDPYSWDRLEVYIKRYFKDQEWKEDLAILNKDIRLPEGFPNASMVDYYPQCQFNCGRKCSYKPNNHCTKCEQYYEIALKLKDKQVEFKNVK